MLCGTMKRCVPPRGRRRDSPSPHPLFLSLFQEVIRPDFLSMKSSLDPFTRLQTRDRAKEKVESRNGRRIEKTLYDRVDKRPSRPKGKSEEEEEAEKRESRRRSDLLSRGFPRLAFTFTLLCLIFTSIIAKKQPKLSCSTMFS